MLEFQPSWMTQKKTASNARQNSHLSSRGIVAIGLPMLEGGIIPGSALQPPGVVWDGSVTGIR